VKSARSTGGGCAGTIVTLFLIAGGMLLMNYSNASLTQLSSLSKSTSPLARGRQLAAPGR
jgi:hypothetical protein